MKFEIDREVFQHIRITTQRWTFYLGWYTDPKEVFDLTSWKFRGDNFWMDLGPISLSGWKWE